MCKLFSNLGFNSREIHSRKDQRYRTRISDEFRQSKGGIILFTSDVSARGVDYPNVTLVVQVIMLLGYSCNDANVIEKLGVFPLMNYKFLWKYCSSVFNF